MKHFHEAIDNGNSVDISELFSQKSWDNGNGPLETETLSTLGLTDETRTDPILFRTVYEGSGYHLGLYTDNEDYYWSCEYTGGIYMLVPIGSTIRQVYEHFDIQAA